MTILYNIGFVLLGIGVGIALATWIVSKALDSGGARW